jgi:hypothetical protein
MSGGSFNYLYTSDAPASQDDMQKMIGALEDLAVSGRSGVAVLGADLAAGVSKDIAGYRRSCPPDDPIREVWKAVEWWRSHDSTYERLVSALTKYQLGIEREMREQQKKWAAVAHRRAAR